LGAALLSEWCGIEREEADGGLGDDYEVAARLGRQVIICHKTAGRPRGGSCCSDMAFVRKSLIVTLHTGLKAGPAHMSSVVAVVRMSSSMELAGIVEPGRIAVPGHIGNWRPEEVAPRQMCTRGDSSP
jgi:hypothetical protein